MLTAEEQLLQNAVKLEKELAPLDLAIDRQKKLPNGLMQKLINAGFLKAAIPEEYGGLNVSSLTLGKIVNTLARACASVGVLLEGHYKSCAQIAKYGTEAAKKKYLTWGQNAILGFSNTEPGGGSNPASHQSQAVKDGDEWIISGDKVMITNGTLAEAYSVNIKTGPNEYTVFIVDKNMPGFSFGRVEDFIGLRGIPCGEVVLDHVRVNESNMLGKRGQGMEIANNAHDDARYLMGAVLTGIQEHALKIVKDYAAKRTSGTTPLKDLQVTQYKITKIATNKELTRLVYQEAARRRDNGLPYMEQSAMAKCFGSKAAVESADLALQTLGGYGYSREFPAEHLIRDARAMEIAEGTVEKMFTEISNAEMASVNEEKITRQHITGSSIDQFLPLLLASKKDVPDTATSPSKHTDSVSGASSDASSGASEVAEGVLLPKASIVLALGRGGYDPETISLAEKVADKLGAAIGVTRPLVGGHFKRNQQLGVNGYTIKPDILINLGISGAPQYTFTVDKAKTIISVNTDPDAAIFQISDYAYKEDAKKFLTCLLEKLS